MCGIAGYVDFATGSPDGEILTAMTASLRRRGPDAFGTMVDGPCGLAHTRLSIIDVAGSPQPMAFGDCDIALVYNGETYNYQELRAELLVSGASFHSVGDTEVVLRSIARDWVDGLSRFDAMYAVGAWDKRRQRLLLARDAVGEKPLFYANPAPGLLVFGSELKALLEHPLVDAELNEDALRQALRFRAVYSAESLHRGIRQLEPGCYLEFSRDGLSMGRYYSIGAEIQAERQKNADADTDALIRRGQALFIDSVKQRLIADVPVGAFLSGGLDSSLIVAAMRQVTGREREIRTYSVGFQDDPRSELPFAKRVAELFGTVHESIVVGPEAYIKRLAELSACRDGPVSQPADVAIAEMSRVARQSVKVALSGEGADEIFAGYPKHAFANAPIGLRLAAGALPASLAAKLAGFAGVDRRRALVALRALGAPREIDRLAQWFSYFDREGLRELLPGLNWSADALNRTMATQNRVLGEFRGESHLLRMQVVDFASWLPGNMLERGDRMTMAEGLEVRPPFLDKELAAFGLSLPDDLKLRRSVGKWIVRQWARDLLPAEIYNREKWGFRVPLAEWFRGPMRDMLHGYLTDGRGLLARYGNSDAVSRLLSDHDTRQIDASEALWTLLTTEVWYQDVYLQRLKKRTK